MQCPGPLSPYRALAIFWDTTLIFTFSVPMVVFIETVPPLRDSELRLVLRQNNWKRSFGTKSFPRCAGLLSKGKITQDLVNPASAGENLARYIIRAFLSRLCPIDRRGFSQERMTYIPEESKCIYQSKDGKEEKAFDALEWPRQAGFKHSLPCVPMSQTRGSKQTSP